MYLYYYYYFFFFIEKKQDVSCIYGMREIHLMEKG